MHEISSNWSYFRRSVLNYNVKCLCLTLQRERERQFIICADSCFQSTGPHVLLSIVFIFVSFSVFFTEFASSLMNNVVFLQQQNTLFELRRPHVPVLDA